ncbi:hypothetical protein B0T16DRAFT_385151 [Cercophora newfieldiana]|uniref:Proteophosphoglycan ppg4 n=1 Tax=Cercophora newfieldiana TaxID=92897 RepID=A0AA40D148_9PEZI|nr:hypothetical protein B0T16DRAFT_385151 [Cercophora newfieldiana]
MGNSQSAIVDFDTHRRRSHRLSKPKTGNYATAGLLSPGGFSNSSKRHSDARMSFLPPPPSPASTPTTASTFDAHPGSGSGSEPYYQDQYMERSASAVSVQRKESRRRSLFRSRSSQGRPDRERRQSSIGPFSRVADRLSRTNSMTYESALSYYGQPAPESWQPPPAGSRTSWNYDMSSYEAKRLLNLAEEPRFELAATMSENKMTVVTETTWKSSNPTQPTKPPSTTISRANSDLSLYMPVRRRSVIQKPGVATRANSLRDGPVARPNFRFSHPPTPNMSRQPSVESFRNGVLSMPPSVHDPEVQRAVTPCEDNYQSTGAFKLGSLRIVNGAASPGSPEVEKNRNRSQGFSSKHADYFGATQIAESSDTAGGKPSIPHIVSLMVEAPQPRAIPLDPINTSFLNLDTPTISPALSPEPAPTSLAATITIVPDYLADITFSPFSLENQLPASPKLETTSRTAALDAHLFEDEPQTEYSSTEVLDVREDANAKPKPERPDGDTGSRFSRTDSGFESARSPSEYSHKQLTKADSGYSSNVSLRSFQAKAQEKELTLSLEKQSSHSSRGGVSVHSEERRSLSFVSAVSHLIPPEREAPPPPVPPKDHPPVSPTQPRPSTSTKKSGESANAPKPSLDVRVAAPPAINLPLRNGGPKSPDSMPRTPGSAKSAKSARSDRSTSALSIGSGSHKPSKLQRLLSSARRPAAGPPTVHATHIEEKANVPVVPREVEHKFHEHTGLFPLTTKRLALKPRASMDTLKTIFSVGSVEASASHEAVNIVPLAAKAPKSVVEEDHEAKEPGWRHTLQAVPSSIVSAAAHVIPRKPVPKRSTSERIVSVKDKGFETPQKSSSPDSILVAEAELSTYTSISNSLGNNAYDVALIAMASGEDGPLSPQIMSRTLTLNESAMRRLELGSPSSSTKSPFNLPSPTPPSPLAARNVSTVDKGKSPPPVSMATRRPMSLRVPQPLRSQSSTERLSRKNSREDIHSYPAAQPPLAKKPSRDSVRSYPAYPQLPNSASDRSDPSPSIPPMDPRRIMSFRQSQYSNNQVQNWETQTEHGYSGQASRSNSMVGHSRNNSVSSAPGGHAGYGIQRPGSAQSWQVYSAKPQLRHRASYDSFNLQQRRSQYGHPPSMSNGYSAPKSKYDPWNSNGQFDPGAGLGLQDSRYPPYVPRGHHRNRSISRVNPSAPYRVLHSYNSPAYRNAPIWG